MRITDEQRQSFVELLRSAREGRGWKQYEAAEHIGLPASTLSRLEHGPYEGMRFEDVVLVCRAYEVPLDAVAALLGMPTGSGPDEGDGLFAVLCATVRALEADQKAFVLKVLQAVLRGL